MTLRSKKPILGGIFAGGRATRMGGIDKGMLTKNGVTLIDRWRALFAEVMVPCVIVGGAHAEITDAITGIGPLGGLIALCERAKGGYAIAVACDMPHVSRALLERLIAAPDCELIAPHENEKWQPLFARYDADRILPRAKRNAERGVFSLQALFEHAVNLELSSSEIGELVDWDEPTDILV